MRTLKKKSISIMLVFTLLMTVFMPVTAFAREIVPFVNQVGIEGDITFSLSSTGVLTWNTVTGATGYKLRGWFDRGTGEDVSSSAFNDIDLTETQYNIFERLDTLKRDSGFYKIDIMPEVSSGAEADSIYIGYTSPYEKLEAPTNLRWDGNVAKWDDVENETGYKIRFWEANGESWNTYTVSADTTSYDFSGKSGFENGCYFEVQAISTGNYRDSERNESPLYGGSSVATSYHVGADVYNITTNEQYTGGKVKIVTPDDTEDYAYVGYGYDVDANAEVTMYAQADTGYEFVEWRTGSESGTQYSTNATVTFNATEDKVLYAIFQQTVSLTQITSVSATVTAPVGGEHPSFTVTVPDGAHYTAVVYAWYDLNNNGAHLTNSDTFVTGNEYQARIHFTANTGYEINSASYTINGTPNYAAFDTAKQRGMIFVATAPAVATYTVTYDANGGTGTMADVTGISGEYTLRANGFTAPDGKQFKAWSVGGVEKAVGSTINVTANTTVTAIWEDIPHTHVYDQTVATSKYKVSSATCKKKAVYYKSCVCGEKGQTTFESGSLAAHTYKTKLVKATTTANGKKSLVCSVCDHVKSTSTIYYAKTFTLSTTSYTYNGKAKTPSVTVKDSKGNTLKKDIDYTVTYASGRKNAGTYKVTVTMKGNYTGTKTLTFKINPISVSKCKITLSTTSYTYNGKVKKPTVTVKNANGTKLTTSSYTVTYASGRKYVGTYKVTIKMKGNYTGTKTLTFKINPSKTTISKLTAGKKSIEVAITKKSTQVTGYQIQYSTSKKFSKATTKTISSYKTTKYTLKSLSAKKTYYVRVRTYKKVGKTKYYSGWSTYKYVKTK